MSWPVSWRLFANKTIWTNFNELNFRSLEDFSLEEITSYTAKINTTAKETDHGEQLGRVETLEYFEDCEFSMESPGMILMYGATLVLVVVAIFGIYIAKRKT